jgi:hypothetical protein
MGTLGQAAQNRCECDFNDQGFVDRGISPPDFESAILARARAGEQVGGR